MSDYINTICAICGKGYHICKSCQGTKTFSSWRTVTDTPGHFKIYTLIHAYHYGRLDREEAASQLKECDLSGLTEFVPEIRAIIEEILAAPSNQNNSD
ncbi:hypothetical protein [Murimonas intestini]|uniref:Uncharacterized protein n=1 Tax=Murimonas intestini TaxID=1337051 RepID=A0AB73T1N6_9FIRM|nr:hypothetical protein [Murimonas intestini]MCR1842526.1 hypothetical protein [Murimonas intestini]MCR1867116.1 hypothetical protein [Murimonas intestini]MCR1884302.1 hypothetical protein [Murimonas intestini]